MCYPAPFLADQSRRYIYYTLRAASSEQCASSDMTITADRLSHAVGGQQSAVAVNAGRRRVWSRARRWSIVALANKLLTLIMSSFTMFT